MVILGLLYYKVVGKESSYYVGSLIDFNDYQKVYFLYMWVERVDLLFQ